MFPEQRSKINEKKLFMRFCYPLNKNETILLVWVGTDNLTSKNEINDINAATTYATTSIEPTEYYFSNKSKENSTDFRVSWNFSSLKVIKTAGWIILLADSLHNFAGSLNPLLFYKL